MSLWWPQALVVPGAMVAVLPGIVLPAWWAARIPPVEALRRRSPLGRRHGWGWMHLLIALGLAIAFLYAYLVHQTALGVNRYLQLSWGSLDERLLLIRSPRESILPPPPLAWEDAALIAGVPGVQLVVPIASQPMGAGKTKAAVGSGVLELGFPPVIEGRGFTPEDFSAPRPVCLISERLARELGLKLAENPTLPVVGVDFQVVGVFEDSYIRSEFPVDVLFTEHYLELVPLRTMRFLVWVARRSDVAGVREEIANRFAARYPGKAKVQVTQAGGTQAKAVRFFRAGALRMGIAALAALVLATGQALGLIGFLLARRQLEYGIRRAVGAPPRQIIFSVVRETASVSSFALVLAISVGALLSPHFLSWFMLLPQPPWWGSLPPLLGVAALIAGGASLPAWKTCRQAPAMLVEGSRE
ncbi:MAG TPA: ABC transporter permease [Candidatus Acetothermia bacterium]|nr:ABC transporter permease [Candidatus Acetothermia bacterium]